MRRDERPLTKREAIDMLAVQLGFVAGDTEVLSTAAYGLRWRNARIDELERLVVKHGGWPWKRRKP